MKTIITLTLFLVIFMSGCTIAEDIFEEKKTMPQEIPVPVEPVKKEQKIELSSGPIEKLADRFVKAWNDQDSYELMQVYHTSSEIIKDRQEYSRYEYAYEIMPQSWKGVDSLEAKYLNLKVNFGAEEASFDMYITEHSGDDVNSYTEHIKWDIRNWDDEWKVSTQKS